MSQRDLKTALQSLERRFISDRAKGWNSTIQFNFSDAAPVTFRIENGALSITEGLAGEHLSSVQTDVAVFDLLFSGRVPLELVLMQDRFVTDCLVEIFKLQTVFSRETS
ncbi:MAG: hypothetical protein WCX65_17050 [bacterium]